MRRIAVRSSASVVRTSPVSPAAARSTTSRLAVRGSTWNVIGAENGRSRTPQSASGT